MMSVRSINFRDGPLALIQEFRHRIDAGLNALSHQGLGIGLHQGLHLRSGLVLIALTEIVKLGVRLHGGSQQTISRLGN